MTTIVTLREIAHSRSGEKGNSSMISVIAYDMADYELLCRQVTVEAVRGLFGPITQGDIERYEAPRIGALNFVLHEVLEGGRSRTLAFEESGKALSSLMLTLPITLPGEYIPRERIGPMAAGSSADEKTVSDASKNAPTPRRLRQLAAPQGDAFCLGGGPATKKPIRLGSATAWSRDRFGPAEALAERGELDYLCFESMSEITMSAAQAARQDGHGSLPYDPYLIDRLGPILKTCKEKGIKIISNQGWLDPDAAALQLQSFAREHGIQGLKIAAVRGGILTDEITGLGLDFLETGRPVAESRADIVSAEAYLGCEGIVRALSEGADVVLTTRVADACLYLGPLAHEFGWSLDDHEKMARGMVIGHLMECGAQVSGGYFADPGYKDVPGLEDLGHPIAEVSEHDIALTKLAGTGGLLCPATCKEQLLYEVGDPSNYLAPDCITDLTQVSFTQSQPDRVEVHIAPSVGKPRPPTLKVLVGVREGYMTEEMVIFAGPGALARAQATQSILEHRFRQIALDARQIRFDYLGLNAVHREASPKQDGRDPYEVILRVAIKTDLLQEADKLRKEIDPLAVNGLYGTGKWATSAGGSRIRSVIGLSSCLVPREHAPISITHY